MFESIILVVLMNRAAFADYDKIELGMTRAQVVKVLRRAPASDVTVAERSSNYFTVSSALIREKGELWRYGSVRIWVLFDEANRAKGMMRESSGELVGGEPPHSK